MSKEERNTYKIESNGKPKKEGRLHKLKVTKIQMLCLMI